MQGCALDMFGDAYLLSLALPSFYFHVTNLTPSCATRAYRSASATVSVRVSEPRRQPSHSPVQIGVGRGCGAGCSALYRAMIGSSVWRAQYLGAPISARQEASQ